MAGKIVAGTIWKWLRRSGAEDSSSMSQKEGALSVSLRQVHAAAPEFYTPAPSGLNKQELEGFEEARRRISECRSTQATALLLTGLHLRSLPPEIASLGGLTVIDARDNAIGPTDARLIAQIHGLQNLYLAKNSIGDEGVASIATIPGLKRLHLGGNGITDLGARPFSALKELSWLVLSDNSIGDEGISSLAEMKGLHSLYLGNNRLGDPGLRSMATLSNLRDLDIGGNPVSNLRPLRNLAGLEELRLDGIRVTDNESGLWALSRLKAVFWPKGRLGDVPQELLSQDRLDNCLGRLRDYFAARDSDRPDVTVRDIKVMILGNGRVGKTQFRRRLKGDAFQPVSISTHGVEIVSVSLPPENPKDTEIPLKVWDFGGQDIYLGTHALFLKTRAVFPILWSPEIDAHGEHVHGGQIFRNYPLKEWLRYVRELSTHDQRTGKAQSPVILVQTRCDAPDQRVAPPVDNADLAGFSIPPEEITYSALPDASQEEQINALRNAAKALSKDGPVVLPGNWAAVKNKIEELAEAGQRTMSVEEFRRVCATEGVTSGEHTLTGLLHDFGTLFHDPAVAPSLIILDQNWALRAIYAVFDREKGAYEQLKGTWRGRFRASELDRLVWGPEGHDAASQNAFLSMMLSCQVAFILRGEAEEFGEAVYVAPDLLPERERIKDELPRYFDETQNLSESRLEFRFAPPSFLRALMAFWGVQAGQGGFYWREGFAIYDRATRTRALLELTRPNAVSWGASLRVAVQQGEAEALLSRIINKVVEIGEGMGAKLAEPTVQPATPELLQIAREGDLIDLGAEFPHREECFISYAHQPDNELSEVAATREAFYAAVVATLDKRGLAAFVDRKNLRNGESISAFMKRGSRKPKIAVILCAKYVQSQFCMNELWWIWQACKSDEDIFIDRVRAICLPDTAIDSPEHRNKISLYWAKRAKTLDEMVRERIDLGLTIAESDNQDRTLAMSLAQFAPTILSALARTLNVRRLEDIGTIDFDPEDAKAAN